MKPNWVKHFNSMGSLDCTVTHPSIIRCLIDYCVVAEASVIEIGDAPIQACDFDSLMEAHGYNKVFEFIRSNGINLKVIDFRKTVTKISSSGMLLQGKSNTVKEDDTIEFDLKNESYFNELPDGQRYRIAQYHDDKINIAHNKFCNKYLFTISVFDADLIINLPKPKTHRFAGLTGAQKNFIGICSDKEYLPHYRIGSMKDGGDESDSSDGFIKLTSFINRQRCKYIKTKNNGMQFLYLSLERCFNIVKRIFHIAQFEHGQWYGNDTIWRTILDINLLLLYGNLDGSYNFKGPVRKILNIGDLIIAGERYGPLEPSPKKLGLILASDNCAVFDYIFCKITGFNYNVIPTIKNSIINQLLLRDPIGSIILNSNIADINGCKIDETVFPAEWKFIPNPLWNDVL